tara:strand:+ start:229 stop:480 length:252 start_codon:yes stop_codon:yes gene_type:complete
MTKLEERWINILKASNSIDLTQPFTAARALDALLLYRNPRSKLALRHAPNKYRLNYVFKKSGDFVCTKDVGNRNHWTIKEVRL